MRTTFLLAAAAACFLPALLGIQVGAKPSDEDDSREALAKSREDMIYSLYKLFGDTHTVDKPVHTSNYDFNCPYLPPSNSTPTSAHELRPADIDVVAALGDSITAGNGAGAEGLVRVIRQNRKLSWSIGGDRSLQEGVLTLPNLLRQYNPDLTGHAIGASTTENYNSSRLNVAEPGGKARDMLEQTEEMIFRMKNWTEIDWDNDWKVVTLFIGGNDLCACNMYSAERYAEDIKEALDLMHAEMPRTFVNLAQTLLVTEINKLDSTFCNIAHLIACPCAKELWNRRWEDYYYLAGEYHKALHNLVQYGQYDTRDDFTVVVQPFFEELHIPYGAYEFLSHDCFHLSEYGHQMVAMSLWNNMIEPVGKKRIAWTEDDVIECPPEDFEYFYTYLNSPDYERPSPGPSTLPPPTEEPTLPYNFTCPITPRGNKPDSVHELRPADIDVVAALGDSITAGYGAESDSLAELNTEYRGRSWSIGGDDSLEAGVLTLANILRLYNKDVIGYSEGVGHHSDKEIAKLNVAISGARASGMLGQTEEMIDRMKTWSEIDYENDWKVVTLFIGGNDLCAYCRDEEGASAKAYAEEVKKALDLMHAEMPRTFVNLVQVLLVTEINKLTGYCDLIHLVACRCAKERWSDDWEVILDLAHEYHRELEELVQYGQYDTRSDFTVVIQPFFEETHIPYLEDEGKYDDGLFAPDCFHFSESGHAMAGMSLWNNMNEPVGAKRTAWLPDDILECPSGDGYLYTSQNSPGYEVPTKGPEASTEKPTMPYTFPCEILPPSDTIPTSAHRLRPADVKVVAALGDSITAANGAGADNIFQVIIEYRGISFSIGGDKSFEEGVLTLSNILRKYNPDLKGDSIETGRHTEYEISRLNVAVPGARARHMLEQTVEMIDRMKTWDEVDYENDWKVVTLFIGGNDLCSCTNYSAEEFAGEIEKALDHMHEVMPRTFVNLNQIVEITEINKLDDPICDVFHLAYCPCGRERYDENWRELTELSHQYHRALEELVESGRYDTREDFTVVLQPFFEQTYVPPNEDGTGWDDSYFSPDCFHFSEYGHQMSAMSLWNNMLEPVGQKRRGWHPDDVFECPKEDFEFFYTSLNSPGYMSTARPTTVQTEETPTEPEEEVKEAVCDDYTGAFITVLCLLGVTLVTCVVGFIWIIMKLSASSRKYDSSF